MMSSLPVDPTQIRAFMFTLFKHANRGYIQFRAFGDNWSTEFPYARTGEWDHALDTATNYAQRCADAQQNIVFCPPITTFSHPFSGKERDVALGLAISAECDTNPIEARSQLQNLLGPPTIVVISGGTTPTGEDKLHLHWRLAAPTRTIEQHATLKRVRKQISKLVNADRTNVPLVHPIRWPGSWHKKSTPRMAYIAELTNNELGLEATAILLNAKIGEEPIRQHQTGILKESDETSVYGWGALVSATANIREATQGNRHNILNTECFMIGTLTAAGEIERQFALQVLEDATRAMRTYPKDNFNLEKALFTMKRAFNDGYRRPRLLNLERNLDGDALEDSQSYE